MMHILFALLTMALVAVAMLGVFKNSLYSRLSTRIITLIFVSSLVAVVITYVVGESIQNSRLRWHVLLTALVVLGGPVVIGLLAARFVRRPLHQFNDAVASLEENNYKVQLQPTGIHEFDEVFAKFNNLIQRLQHEEKLRKDLVSDTSHELNTPLTTMIGQLTAMQEGKYSLTQERVTILKEQAERLAELVEQLDAYTKARIPSSDTPEDIPAKQFCKQLIDHFSDELKQKNLTVNLAITDDLILHANRDALQRILTNLTQNTLRYSGATKLTITASGRQLIFTDNGKGVPPESLPYLFERFYRVDASRDRATGGLGLGLAIVKEVAEQQGWHIHAEPAQPGLSFVVVFQ